MSDEEKEFSKKVNIDKAKIKNGTCITLSIISLITYIAPLMLGDFDFGIVFESLTFIFIDLKKAGDPEKYKESTDWFYERPDEKKENNKNL